MSRPRGFTLIELLVVISIIGLLSSVVIASLNAAREKGRLGAAKYFAAQADHVVGDSATAIWDFNENSGTSVSDRSGFGNHGTMNTAGWTTDTPSGLGAAGSFSSSRYVTSPSQDHTDAITVSAWFKSSGSSADGGIVGEYDYGASARSWVIYVGANTGTVWVNISSDGTYSGSTIKSYRTNTSFTDGKWHHASFTFSNNNLRIYVDGAQVPITKTYDAAMNSLNSSNSPVIIGAYLNSGSPVSFFVGSIDEVKIFGTSLTASEIGQLYAESATKYRFADADN